MRIALNCVTETLESRKLMSVVLDDSFAQANRWPFRSDESITDIQALPDGGILAIGHTIRINGVPRNDLLFVRLREDGTRDTSFGRAVRGLSGQLANISINSDGDVLATTRNGAQVTLARYTARGSFDDSFSGDGKMLLDLGSNVTGAQADLTNDGAVTVFYEERGFVNAVRYFGDGRRDRRFGGAGKLRLVDFEPDAADDDTQNIQVYQAGAGGTVMAGGDLTLAHNSSLRQSYATIYSRSGAGAFVETIGTDDSDVEVVAVRDDGEPVYAGSYSGGDSFFGSRSIGFNSYELPGVGFDVYIRGVEFTRRGEAYFWAMHQNELDQGSPDVFLTRLRPDGSLDSAYGNSGFVTFDPIESPSPSAYVASEPIAMTVDRLGRPIIITRTHVESLTTWSIVRLPAEQPPPAFARISRTGTLLVQGTAGDDSIDVLDERDWDPAGPILVRIEKDAMRFDRSAFRRVYIDGGDGDDSIIVTVGGLRGTVLGGAGDDSIDAAGDRLTIQA